MSADSVLLPAVHERFDGASELLSGRSAVRPVDAFEVAAALEAAGINDTVARQRYGQSDVFALARHRFDKMAVRQATVVDVAPPPIDIRGTLLRGLVFVLPALLTGAVMGRHPELPLVWAVLVAVAVGWAAGQGIAYVGYRVLGAGSKTGARWQMMVLAVLTLVLTSVGGVVAGVLGVVTWPAILLAVGQIAFVLCSSIALVLDRPAVIGLTLVPGLCASFPALVRPDLLPRWLVLAAISTTLLLTLGWVGYLLRGARPPAARLARAAARGALPYVAYGIGLALLLSFALVDSIVAPTHPAISVTMAPLMCGVVIAEFQLARYRRRAEIALRATDTRAGASRALRRAVLGCVLGYLLGLFGLTVVVAVVLVPDLNEVAILRFAGAGALGWAFLAALLLVAYQQLRAVLVTTALALVLLAGRGLVPPFLGADKASELAMEYLTVCTVLAVLLTTVALRLLVKPELHR
jgi:hypothetical protein